MSEQRPIEPAPAIVQQLAAACMRYVEKATGVALDYEPETLPLLDHYLAHVPDQGDEVRALVAPAAGAYFGEVVRRAFLCRWYAPADDYGTWRVEFENVFLHFNPIAFAHEAIVGDEVVEGGAGFGVLDQDLEAVRGGLAALGTVNEEDYFKLATRYEVLSTVVDRLVGGAAADGAPVVRFDALAYRAALDDVDDGAAGKLS